jgi:hypothetical protein
MSQKQILPREDLKRGFWENVDRLVRDAGVLPWIASEHIARYRGFLEREDIEDAAFHRGEEVVAADVQALIARDQPLGA